jgi:putative methionine-R-sulfoxide reductase with GAF domain
LKTYRSTREVLAQIQRDLATARLAPGSNEPLEKVVETLSRGRHYLWVGLYLVVGDKLIRSCYRGPQPLADSVELGDGNLGTAAKTGVAQIFQDVSAGLSSDKSLSETKSEAVQPIKLVTRVLGVVAVQSAQRFRPEDRVLLKQVSVLLARFLTGRGKYLLRRANEAQRSSAGSARVAVRSAPQAEKNYSGPAGLRAVAGTQTAK